MTISPNIAKNSPLRGASNSKLWLFVCITSDVQVDCRKSLVLERAIQQRIENPVAKLILQGKFGPKDVIPVTVGEGGEFHFERVVH